MDAEFESVARTLFNPLMGTEHVAGLLHSLVRMTRPRRVLEVGLGYTSLFLLDALRQAKQDHADDQRVLRAGPGAPRSAILNEGVVEAPYDPLLLAIDDFSRPESRSPKVAGAAERLGLARFLKLLTGDFRDVVALITKADLPLDMIWFDCGGPKDYVDCLLLLWPLLSPSYGLLGLHYTYWAKTFAPPGKAPFQIMVPGDILDRIKHQQAELGHAARFETLSLLEPHKTRQGSITLVRKLPHQDRIRAAKDPAAFDLGQG